MGLGNERSTLKTSRAYVAGLGTTGVLIGSFILLLTVGSTLVAFRGVPGAASNGDLSSIELRQQREAAAQRGAGLITVSNVLGDYAQGSQKGGATGDAFGRVASAGVGNPTGNIRQGTSGSSGPDALRPTAPGAPLSEKAPTTNPPATSPGSDTGVIATPVDPGVLADDTSSSSGDTGSSTDTGSGTGSGTDTGSSGGSSGSGSTVTPTGTDTGSGTSGGATGTVGDTVEDTTGSAGTAVGTVSPGAGSTVTDTGSAVGGLLDDATSAVEGLTGTLGAAG